MRDMPELEVVALQRGSDTQVSLTRECRAPWGRPHQEHRRGQVSLGLEMEGTAWRRRHALLTAGTTTHACEWRQGASKGGISARASRQCSRWGSLGDDVDSECLLQG